MESLIVTILGTLISGASLLMQYRSALPQLFRKRELEEISKWAEGYRLKGLDEGSLDLFICESMQYGGLILLYVKRQLFSRIAVVAVVGLTGGGIGVANAEGQDIVTLFDGEAPELDDAIAVGLLHAATIMLLVPARIGRIRTLFNDILSKEEKEFFKNLVLMEEIFYKCYVEGQITEYNRVMEYLKGPITEAIKKQCNIESLKELENKLKECPGREAITDKKK